MQAKIPMPVFTRNADHETASKWAYLDLNRHRDRDKCDCMNCTLARAYLDLASRLAAVDEVVGEMRALADERTAFDAISKADVLRWADRLQPSAPEPVTAPAAVDWIEVLRQVRESPSGIIVVEPQRLAGGPWGGPRLFVTERDLLDDAATNERSKYDEPPFVQDLMRLADVARDAAAGDWRPMFEERPAATEGAVGWMLFSNGTPKLRVVFFTESEANTVAGGKGEYLVPVYTRPAGVTVETLRAAIKSVRDVELFEDGVSADLHCAGIENEADAYIKGRKDALDEVEAALAEGGVSDRPTCPKCNELFRLLLEARDALPAISLASAKLHGLDLTLADRMEAAMEPWEIKEPQQERSHD